MNSTIDNFDIQCTYMHMLKKMACTRSLALAVAATDVNGLPF